MFLFAEAFRDESLDPFCQVHSVRKIKSAVFLQLLNHLNEGLIIFMDSGVAGIVDWDKKQLFNSKNVTFQQAANQGSSFYQNEMGSCGQINMAKDSVVFFRSTNSCLLDFCGVLKSVLKHLAGLRLRMDFHDAATSANHDFSSWQYIHVKEDR